MELWFHLLPRLGEPWASISDNAELALKPVIQAFLDNGIGLSDEERKRNLTLEVEAWLNG